MKPVFLPLLPAIFLLGGFSLHAEDWKTIDGKVYLDVKVIKVEPDAVTILDRDGGALIPLIMLPDDLQKKFNYNAASAKAAADARMQADLENAHALGTEREQVTADRVASDEATQKIASDSTQTASNTRVYSDPSHHSISDLVNTSQTLRDDATYGPTHYTMGYFAAHGASLSTPPDPKHYSINSAVDGSDPTNQ